MILVVRSDLAAGRALRERLVEALEQSGRRELLKHSIINHLWSTIVVPHKCCPVDEKLGDSFHQAECIRWKLAEAFTAQNLPPEYELALDLARQTQEKG
jgi:hypothetical protein